MSTDKYIMLKFNNFLVENQEINLAMKAYKTLSPAAKEAIDGYESYNWHSGELSKSVRVNGVILGEILDAFEPVKQYLKSRHGTHITLYRGVNSKGHEAGDPYAKDRVLTSWTSDKRVAGTFAGLNRMKYTDKGRNDHRGSWRSSLSKVLPDSKVQEIIDNFNKRGYASDGYYKWVVSKEDPQYYWIWARNEKLTDGYTKDFAKDRWQENNERKEENDEKLVHRRVIEKKIPIDDIIWLTNNLSSKEYIVLNR